MDCSPPGSTVPGTLWARFLDQVTISYSRAFFPTQALNSGLKLGWQIPYHCGKYKWVSLINEWKLLSRVWLFATLWMDSPGQNTEVGSHSLLQAIFPTQGSNPGLLHCRQILYQLSHQGSLRILEWVAYPFSSRFSWPRNWTTVSLIAGWFFTNWAIREAQIASP